MPVKRVTAVAAAALAAGVAQSKALDRTGQKDTPVTRVVNLLKEMQETVSKEQDEDEAQHHELACWCNNGAYEKGEAAEAGRSNIAMLESTIESLTAKSADLDTRVKELNSGVASDKTALATATNLRKKQGEAFHKMEMDSIQALENIKAALTVMGHPGFLQLPLAKEAMQQLPLSFLELRSRRKFSSQDETWAAQHDSMFGNTMVLDEFMNSAGLDGSTTVVSAPAVRNLRQSSSPTAGSSAEDEAVVKRALKSAAAFMQRRQAGGHMSFAAGSDEIVGVMKQLKEEMEADLKEAQETEQERVAMFTDLRASKEQEIADGHNMAEQKEDELAQTNNDLAEAKEDFGQEQATLASTEKFLANLKKTCDQADADFDARKLARTSEIGAISETVEILTGDEARDAMEGTYNFVQLGSKMGSRARRMAAARVLRRAAIASGDAQLSVLASSVQLDQFAEVKKAIDELIAAMKVQQEDEVKKNDWCGEELQRNEMTIATTKETKTDLETKIAGSEEHMKAHQKAADDAMAQLQEALVEMQRASQDRVAANLEFQKTMSDQTLTIEILQKALKKLSEYYGSAFLQTRHHSTRQRQTPPVAQAEYKPNAGAAGIVQMMEKLIQDAKALVAEAKKSEMEAQQAYEQTVSDFNDEAAALQAEATSKTKANAKAQKDKLQTEGDHSDTVKELKGLDTYEADLHEECDYILKNFNTRQQARAAEIESLQQADQILSGAAN